MKNPRLYNMDLDEMTQKLRQGKLSRRDFLRLATTMGVSAGVAQFLVACAAPAAPIGVSPTVAPAAGPTQAPAAAGAKGTGIAILAAGAEVSQWDPATSSRADAAQVVSQVYDGLFRFDGWERVNQLAESHSFSPDGSTLTVNLRKGVKFHDGTDLKASDVIYSWKRIMDLKGPYSLLWNGIIDQNNIKATDDYTVAITLPSPYGPILDTLAWVYVVNEKLLRSHYDGDDYGQKWLGQNDAGSGPYTITSNRPGEQLEFSRFADYWRGWGNNYLDGFVMQTIREPATIRLAMQTGKAHAVQLWSLPVDSMDTVQQAGVTDIFEYNVPSVVAIKMNNQKAPTNDVNFRKAMAYAFDYDAVIKGLMKGRTDYNLGAYPKGYLYWKSFENSDMLYRRNLDKAREYLQKSGFDPASTTLAYNYRDFDPTQRDYGLVLQASLKELGINIEMQGLTAPEFSERQKTPKNAANFNRISGRGLMSDPDLYCQECLNSATWAGDRGYWATMTFYKNAQVDDLINKARHSNDQAARKGMYEQLQDIVYNDSPDIWVDQQHFLVSVNKKLKGFTPQPLGGNAIDFSRMYFET